MVVKLWFSEKKKLIYFQGTIEGRAPNLLFQKPWFCQNWSMSSAKQ
jgi:hypothetical protein